MSDPEPNESAPRTTDFEARASRAAGMSGGPAAEFLYFLRRSRKWWMTPILAALLLVGVVLVMSSSAVAPLIYALF
jgi:hypothetical protein